MLIDHIKVPVPEEVTPYGNKTKKSSPAISTYQMNAREKMIEKNNVINVCTRNLYIFEHRDENREKFRSEMRLSRMSYLDKRQVNM